MLNKFAFVPAGAANPFTRFEHGGLFADEFNHVLDAGDFAECDVVKNGGFVEVTVGIDQARRDGQAVEIENFCRLWRDPANFVVAADRRDFAVMNRESLSYGVFCVDGNNVPVEEDEIGGLAATWSSAKRKKGKEH